MKVSRLYPDIGYSPDMMHCAFGFDGMFEVAEFQRGDPNASGKELEELIVRNHAYYDDLKRRFPKQEDFGSKVKPEEMKACKRFTSLDADVVYFCRDLKESEKPALVLEYHYPPYAPQLGFELEGSFVTTHLHNCANAQLALTMYFHGLRALRTIYDAYDIKRDFLPSIGFEDTELTFSVPFKKNMRESRNGLMGAISNYLRHIPYPGEIIRHDGHYWKIKIGNESTSMKKASSENADGMFIARINSRGKKTIERNDIAVHMFNICVMQSLRTYFRDDAD